MNAFSTYLKTPILVFETIPGLNSVSDMIEPSYSEVGIIAADERNKGR